MQRTSATGAAGFLFAFLSASATAEETCKHFGPQAPRDISVRDGTNPRKFALAGPVSEMNLCNIHFHVNAEHKGPGFALPAGPGEHGGFKCNDSERLTPAELAAPAQSGCHGLEPGDTVEVHWVYSSCDVKPGKGLGACSSPSCANPSLRVEAQVFLVVNDGNALDFARFDAAPGATQPASLPRGTGRPRIYRGSTTGPSYTQSTCSPLQVTWSVRPRCARLDINSLGKWCAYNAFEENHGHGVRQLVTSTDLLDRVVGGR
ncbi:MAG: delta-class carbonic anhydrase [Hyphomicrobiaceae bacterium]|nr:delta-class carbonic anhydrase [Hyphomicrobiaceae bacterium]